VKYHYQSLLPNKFHQIITHRASRFVLDDLSETEWWICGCWGKSSVNLGANERCGTYLTTDPNQAASGIDQEIILIFIDPGASGVLFVGFNGTEARKAAEKG
jgi:hypothetical protein